MPLCNLAWDWAHVTLHLDERGWTIRGGVAERGDCSENLPVKQKTADTSRSVALMEGSHSRTRAGSNTPLLLSPTRSAPSQGPGHPWGLPLPPKAQQESISALLLPKNTFQCGCRRATLFLPLLEEKTAWVSLLCKGARLVFPWSSAGWLQQTQCKGDASKLFPEYLSLLSDLCCGKGSFFKDQPLPMTLRAVRVLKTKTAASYWASDVGWR